MLCRTSCVQQFISAETLFCKSVTPKPSKDMDHKCQIRDKNFPMTGDLKTYKKSHTVNEGSSFICNHCDLTFPQAFQVKNHRQFHTGETHCACNQCEQNFSQENNLKIHKRVHTGDTRLSTGWSTLRTQKRLYHRVIIQTS